VEQGELNAGDSRAKIVSWIVTVRVRGVAFEAEIEVVTGIAGDELCIRLD